MGEQFKEGPGWYLVYVGHIENDGAMMSIMESIHYRDLITTKLEGESEEAREIEAKRIIGNTSHNTSYIVFYEKKI